MGLKIDIVLNKDSFEDNQVFFVVTFSMINWKLCQGTFLMVVLVLVLRFD